MELSPIIVGSMRLGKWGANMSTAQYESFIEQCIELGLIDFDHADIYGDYTTEEEFGAVLRKKKKLRKKIRLTTKCGIKMVAEKRPDHQVKSYDSSSKHIIASAEQSLKNFGTDHIDLFLIHRPDLLMDGEEIAEAISTLKKQGKILHFGVSNFQPQQLDYLYKLTDIRTNQIEASITHLDPFHDGTLLQCQQHKIVPTAWSALGGGVLFAKRKTERQERILKKARVLCETYRCTIDQLVIAWLHKHPSGIIPVLGTTKILRLASALEALQIEMTHEDWYDFYQASTGEEIA